MIWLHTVTILEYLSTKFSTTWQTCLKYTQLFDFGPEILRYTSPTLYPADAPWSQLSKKRIISGQSLALFEKIAAACDEPARNWDRGQKIGIFQSNPLHRALIQNRPKTGKNVDFSKSARFFENISRAACSSQRQASKTPLFGVVYPDISIRNLFKTDPPRF